MHELRVLYCTRSLGSSRPTTCFQLNFDCRMREAKRRTLKFACFFVSNRPSPSGFILRRTDFLIISKTERSLCLKAFKGTTPRRSRTPSSPAPTHTRCVLSLGQSGNRFFKPTLSQEWPKVQRPRAAICVQSVDVHVSCSSHDNTEFAPFFIDPRAEGSTELICMG